MLSKTVVSVVSVVVTGSLLAIGGQAFASTTKPAPREQSRVVKARETAKPVTGAVKDRATTEPATGAVKEPTGARTVTRAREAEPARAVHTRARFTG